MLTNEQKLNIKYGVLDGNYLKSALIQYGRWTNLDAKTQKVINKLSKNYENKRKNAWA